MHNLIVLNIVYKCGQKFKAQIQIERVQHYLGLFDSEIEAAVAYDNHARVSHVNINYSIYSTYFISDYAHRYC